MIEDIIPKASEMSRDHCALTPDRCRGALMPARRFLAFSGEFYALVIAEVREGKSTKTSGKTRKISGIFGPFRY